MKTPKKIPYGLTDFERIRDENYVYVDKAKTRLTFCASVQFFRTRHKFSRKVSGFFYRSD